MLISYARHQFPPVVIQYAIWLYVRFTLSYRDVEELLAERGLEVSYETIRRWVLKFGPAIARRLRRRRPQPTGHWHLDEMVVRIAGQHLYLWRADDDGSDQAPARVSNHLRYRLSLSWIGPVHGYGRGWSVRRRIGVHRQRECHTPHSATSKLKSKA